MTFDQLGLEPDILRAVKEAGYSEPTPIQQQAIGPVLAGRDIVGCAQTGTGKTAAFALPILQRIDARAGDDPVLRALVLTPTRELAAQIGASFEAYGKHLDLWHTVIFGGVSEAPQLRELSQGVDILIATPGRLLDLHGRGKIDLRRIEIFVLDEADRMLDQGFMPDVKRVIAALPPKRQNLLFSATMPPEIRALADTLLHDPVSVAVAPQGATTADNIEQRLYFVERADKPRLLLELLKSEGVTRTVVFSRTKHGANRVAQALERAGLRAAAIHGNKSQNARVRALEAFKQGELRVLVATDLAARGIDIDAVSHVINYDLPNVPETYVHRIGRTARAGASGVAMSLCDTEEREYLVDIERLIGRHLDRIDHAAAPRDTPPPTDLASRTRPAARPASGPRPGARRSGRGRGGGGGGRAGHSAGRPSSASRRR
ncbi:MAG: DEAD/DEAH box helicase [Nannocystaceae bacterium]|nr:DEAD/DEAH box helicase [Nannocystaceae bacterium]